MAEMVIAPFSTPPVFLGLLRLTQPLGPQLEYAPDLLSVWFFVGTLDLGANAIFWFSADGVRGNENLRPTGLC